MSPQVLAAQPSCSAPPALCARPPGQDGCCLPTPGGRALICLLFPHTPQRRPGSWPHIPWTLSPREGGGGQRSKALTSPSILSLAVLFSAPCANSSGARAQAFPARCSGQLGRQALCSGTHALRCGVRGCPARLRAPRPLLAVPPAPRRGGPGWRVTGSRVCSPQGPGRGSSPCALWICAGNSRGAPGHARKHRFCLEEGQR